MQHSNCPGLVTYNGKILSCLYLTDDWTLCMGYRRGNFIHLICFYSVTHDCMSRLLSKLLFCRPAWTHELYPYNSNSDGRQRVKAASTIWADREQVGIAMHWLTWSGCMYPTFCLPWAAMMTLNWKVPLTGAVNRPVSGSYACPTFVTTRSNTMSECCEIGPMLFVKPTKNATPRRLGAAAPNPQQTMTD